MEQQTISVAKAGIICKLNSNPTYGSIYDESLSLERNSRLGSALLSRFDMIFDMLDQAQLERDVNIAHPGVGVRSPSWDGPCRRCQRQWPLGHGENACLHRDDSRKVSPNFDPRSVGLLENHYSLCRQQENGQTLITVSFLESLIRLSQAHARLMYRDKVLLDDAVAVILLSAPPRHRVVGYLAVAESITPPTISSMIAWQRIQSTPNLDRSMNWMSNLRKRKRSCFVGIKAEIRMQRDIQWSLPAHALLFRNSQCMG